jgi:hypothetical protein
MAHGDVREGKWRGHWRMEWVASSLYTTSEDGVSSITTVDAHTSAATSRLNWRPRQFKWTPPFRGKTKSDFCACAITFQKHSTTGWFCVTGVCMHIQIASLYRSFKLYCGTTRHCERFTVLCFILWKLGVGLDYFVLFSEAWNWSTHCV